MTGQPIPEKEQADAEDANSTQPRQLEDAEVISFLEADPEFFIRQPDLTARMDLPHGPNGAVSLVQHQISVLRTQLDTERRRLTHLIARAREFETLSRRLHTLVLQLISAPDLERIEAVLRESLCDEFNAEAVTLKLFTVEDDDENADPLVAAFLEFVDGEHALCGPLDDERGTALFGAESDKILSAALVPIRGEMRAGVLAIGSEDPARFRPEMGTEHLDRLGEVVSRRIGVINHADA